MPARRAAKPAQKPAARKARVKKPVKKAARKVAEKPAKKASEKIAEKVAEKPAKHPAKKVSGKAAAKAATKPAAKPPAKQAPAVKAGRKPRAEGASEHEAEVLATLKRAEKALLSSEPPGLLSLEEFLWIVASVRDCARKAGEEPSEAALELAIDDALDKPLRDRIEERLVTVAAEHDASARELSRRADVALAWGADPVRLVVALFTQDQPRFFLRDPREEDFFPSDPGKATAESFAAWAALLDGMGEKAGAALVRRSAKLLGL
jgi:hypothetical protein